MIVAVRLSREIKAISKFK